MVRVVEEPRLTERMVERCLETGARVTPVGGRAAAMLAETGGVAAQLRWQPSRPSARARRKPKPSCWRRYCADRSQLR